MAQEVIKLCVISVGLCLSHGLTHEFLKVFLERLKIDLIGIGRCGILQYYHLQVTLLHWNA